MWIVQALLASAFLLNGLEVGASSVSSQQEPIQGDKSVVVDESYSFNQFVDAFGKSYSNDEEYQRRKVIFEANLQTILSHNAHVDLEQGGHLLGVNPFADLLPDEIPRGYDKIQSSRYYSSSSSAVSRRLTDGRVVMREEELPITMEPVSSLPKSVDWRKKGVTTPVKSQGGCGSCWAFASTAVLESHIAIKTGTLFSLSEQELVSCASNPLHCGGSGGCAGSTAEIAFDFVAQKGMVQEWNFGYQSYHGESVNCTLKEVTTSPSIRGGPADTHFKGAAVSIQGYGVLPSNDYTVVMNVIAKLGPMAVSVACFPWQLYHGGVFYAPLNNTRATDVNHLVVLEGYGTDEETGEDYWLIRNSWGPMWGEHGYIRLLRVDPSTLDDPDSDCGMDTSPADGVACTKDDSGNDIKPPAAKICGTSGILYDTTIPLGGHLMHHSP